MGRFFTLDPLDLATTGEALNGRPTHASAGHLFQPLYWNRFVYANADPVNNIDPTGREFEEEIATLTLGMNLLNLGIHALELELHSIGTPETESEATRTRGAMYCTAAIGTVEPFLELAGDFDPYVGLTLAGVGLACTFTAVLANAWEHED